MTVRKSKIYLAGPITGNDGYRELFGRWEEYFRGEGYTVLNPAVLPEGMTPEEYMTICFVVLEIADAIALLPGYEGSRVALLEATFARYADKPEIIATEEMLGAESPAVLTDRRRSCAVCGAPLKSGQLCGDCERIVQRTPGRLTWSALGNWGVVGADVRELPPALYGALAKLKAYEEVAPTPDAFGDLLDG